VANGEGLPVPMTMPRAMAGGVTGPVQPLALKSSPALGSTVQSLPQLPPLCRLPSPERNRGPTGLDTADQSSSNQHMATSRAGAATGGTDSGGLNVSIDPELDVHSKWWDLGVHSTDRRKSMQDAQTSKSRANTNTSPGQPPGLHTGTKILGDNMRGVGDLSGSGGTGNSTGTSNGPSARDEGVLAMSSQERSARVSPYDGLDRGSSKSKHRHGGARRYVIDRRIPMAVFAQARVVPPPGEPEQATFESSMKAGHVFALKYVLLD